MITSSVSLQLMTWMQPIAELLAQDADFLSQYKLVLVSGPLKRSSLNALCQGARELHIPVLYTHSVGFYSTFSLQLPPEFPIVETHPDPETTQDLRLLSPWPELIEAGARINNLDSLDDHQHGHVPYILLLLHYLEKWKASHDGNIPSNYKEKTEFRELVRASARMNNPEGGEENYDEAAAAVLKALNPFSLRSSLREIFEMEECRNLKPESADFWVIASAINEFYQKHQVLPLPGSLPDMKAQSADYVALQNIYKSKAKKDVEEVTGTVRRVESQLGSRAIAIPEKEIEIFCKNAAHIKVVHGRDIPQLDQADAHMFKTIRNNLGFPETLIPIFLATQILDAIVTDIQEGKRASGSIDGDAVWTAQIDRVANAIRGEDPTVINEDVLQRIIEATQELRRSEGGELHNISALAGGLVAQEALKVITRQYVPLDNTCVFDGVRSRSEMYKL